MELLGSIEQFGLDNAGKLTVLGIVVTIISILGFVFGWFRTVLRILVRLAKRTKKLFGLLTAWATDKVKRLGTPLSNMTAMELEIDGLRTDLAEARATNLRLRQDTNVVALERDSFRQRTARAEAEVKRLTATGQSQQRTTSGTTELDTELEVIKKPDQHGWMGGWVLKNWGPDVIRDVHIAPMSAAVLIKQNRLHLIDALEHVDLFDRLPMLMMNGGDMRLRIRFIDAKDQQQMKYVDIPKEAQYM